MRKLRKIQFIYPKVRRFYRVLAEWSPLFRTTDYEADAHTRTPPCLAFPLLAALTPRDIEIDFLDDRIDALELSRLDADLYCLHVKTEMAPRAYQLADEVFGPLSGVDIVPIQRSQANASAPRAHSSASRQWNTWLIWHPDGRGTTRPPHWSAAWATTVLTQQRVFSGSYV